MKKEAALDAILRHRDVSQIVVVTMGVAMPWARRSNSPWDFFCVDGAMGHAADFSLGLALARPERRVICLNGDGSMLMCLETLVTAAAQAVPNFILVVMENGTYEVTGNQGVPGAGRVDWVSLARGAGWVECLSASSESELSVVWPKALKAPGPVFVSIRIDPGTEPPPNRKEPLAQDCRRIRTLLQFEDSPGKMPGFDPASFAALHRAELFPRES